MSAGHHTLKLDARDRQPKFKLVHTMREPDATITVLQPLQGFHFDLISDVFISEEL